MNSEFKELQNKWETNKKNMVPPTVISDNLYRKIKIKEKENYVFYYGTISILLATLIVVALFFYHLAPVKETISRVGVGLMLSVLVFRIFIEIISIYKAKKINNLDSILKTAENSINFHQFRKTIHQVIAPIIIGLYTIGFYLITPEFMLYLKFEMVLFFDVLYIIIGIVLFILIRKGVKKEMQKLADIVKLKNEILE